MNGRECFCGCGRDVVTSSQLAGNLLGWDMTDELGEWMHFTAPLELLAPDRDRGNEQRFIGDGREMWLSLRDQVHGGLPQARQDRRVTKRWLKFSKKERKKAQKAFVRSELGDNPFANAAFSPQEIRDWLLMDEWPDWTTISTRRAENAKGDSRDYGRA